MKTFLDYIAQVRGTTEDTDMKPMKIVAEQTNEDLVLWNTENDRWSRKAKHQLRINEVDTEQCITWEKGDIAVYESHAVEVTVPKGPNGTIGILFEGRTKMVLVSRLERLDEGVLGGMQPLNPINRIMQLAGIGTPTIVEPVVETEEIEEADSTNMFQQLFNANLNGEYRNNPDAARLATIGQIMVGLESQVEPLRGKVTSDLENKINMAVGLGAALMTAAKSMTQAK
jgi:hypothetical protein